MNAFVPELSRKTVHLTLGTMCLGLPWLFTSAAPVLCLAAIATVALLAVRIVPVLRAGIGRSLHGVTRTSYGEFAFVFGIAATFVLAHGDVLSYVIPVAVLTYADAVAALIGTRFGLHRFRTVEGTKSLEGSAAFFIVSLMCVALPLVLTGQPNALLIAATVSAILMMVEASSWSGLDNAMIPLAGGLLVRSLATGTGFSL